MAKRRSSQPLDAKAASPSGKPIGRRQFVAAAGVFAATQIVGCGTESITGPQGTIDLTINGLDPAATSGGSVIATPTAGGTPVNITIPPLGHQTALAPAGDYTVLYTPPANHALGPGQQNPRTITITAGQTTAVTVDLVSSGTIQVTVTGLTGSPPDGGTAVAQRTDVSATPVNINISAAGSGSASVPTGTYTVTYSPPAGFNVNGGVTNPVTGLVVTLSAPAGVSFAVSPPVSTGTIQITINGLTGSPPNGGSASAQRTDAAASPVPISISAAGSGSAVVPAGTYTVTYSPPGGFQISAGSSNPRTGQSVANGGTTNIAWNVEVVVPGPGLLFESDWSTATGGADNALRDTNKALPWDARTGTLGVLDVIPAAGRQFPANMANILRVKRQAGSPTFGFMRIADKWPEPAVGESLFFRLYLRNEISDVEGDKGLNSHHPIQTDPSGPWAWHFSCNGNGTFPIYFGVTNAPFPKNHWILGIFPGVALSKSGTYRLEWRIRRDSATLYSVHSRIYNSSNQLVWSEDGVGASGGAFMGESAGTQPTQAQANGTMQLTSNTDLRHLEIGSNGGPTFIQDEFFYYGGMMVRKDNWCGPY